MILFEAYNLPFTLSLIVLGFIVLLQIIGAGDFFDSGDVDIDVDVDVDFEGPDGVGSGGGLLSAAFSLLGLGRVPFLIWLMVLLFLFASIGLIGQNTLIEMVGAPLPSLIAAGLAALAAVPLNGIVSRPLAKLLPQDETSAVGLDSLVRRDAEIAIGTATAGSPARAKAVDVHGHPHFVMVEPHDPTAQLSEGETVLLVRREGQTFFAVHYESPQLALT